MNARKLSLLALAAAGLAVAGSASAQTRTYNFADRNIAGAPLGGCNTNLTSTGSLSVSFGNTVRCNEAGNGSTTSSTLDVRAWSSDGSSSTYRTAAVNDQGGNGFGIFNQTETLSASSPAHGGDNITPGIDLWQLSFTTAQALRSVTIGWAGFDGDFQVLRWAGTGSATSISGRTAAQLITDGWQLMSTGVGSDNVFNGIGNASTGSNGTDQTFNFNSTGLSSTAWLISAYNSAWAGSGATNVSGGDSIKLLGITTTAPTSVSAPGTLVLAGLGLLGAGLMRRRNA